MVRDRVARYAGIEAFVTRLLAETKTDDGFRAQREDTAS